MPRRNNKPWTPEEIARLIELADSGASLKRARAALKRPKSSVAAKAHALGKPLAGVRQIHKALKEAGVLDEDNRR